MTIENISENQGKLGKLKLVSRVRDSFTCYHCKDDIASGSKCYDQSDYTGTGFFPSKRRMCVECGEKFIAGGLEVKEKKVKAPNKEKPEKVVINPKDGCGKDTEYPKPDKSGVWKCGEKAPVVGIMNCKDCGGFK